MAVGLFLFLFLCVLGGNQIVVFAITTTTPPVRSLDGSELGGYFGAGPGMFLERDFMPLSLYDGMPSAREISNVLFALDPSGEAPKRSTLFIFWGQMIAHDISHTPDNTSEPMYISVPRCDSLLDTSCSGNSKLRFFRSQHVSNSRTGWKRVPINEQTAPIDCSFLYGTSTAQSATLRAFVDGKLRTSAGNMPPLSVKDEANWPGAPNVTHFYFADIRSNQNPALTSLVTILIREHNRRCDELITANGGTSVGLTDEFLFQAARRWVIAIVQKITYEEYVPLLVGKPLPTYSGFRLDANPAVDALFAHAAFRYGHSSVPSALPLVREDGSRVGEATILFRDTYFQPIRVLKYGVEPLLLGAALEPEMNVDTSFTADIRQFSPWIDIAAIDVQRGRDNGLPLYNDAREELGLPRIQSFDNFTSIYSAGDIDAMKALYGSVDRMDAIVGGLAERPLGGSAAVGEMFAACLYRQFLNIRDGDPFWYEGIGNLLDEEVTALKSVTMASVIKRNANFNSFPTNPFLAQPWIAPSASSSSSSSSSGTSSPLDDLGLDFSAVVPVLSTPKECSVAWALSDDSSTVTFALIVEDSADDLVGVGIGFNTKTMYESDVVVMKKSADSLTVTDMHIRGSRNLETDDKQNIISGSSKRMFYNGYTYLVFSRLLSTGDSTDEILLTSGATSIIVAVFHDQGTADLVYHGNSRGSATIYLGEGLGVSDNTDSVFGVRHAHALSMFISWLVLMPISSMFPRYFKTVDAWIILHRTASLVAIAASLSSAASLASIRHADSIIAYTLDPVRFAHIFIGAALCVALFLQLLLGAIFNVIIGKQRGTLFEYRLKTTHHYGGYVLMGLGGCQALIGSRILWTRNSTPIIATWICIVLFIIFALERRKRAQDMVVATIAAQGIKGGRRGISSLFKRARGGFQKRRGGGGGEGDPHIDLTKFGLEDDDDDFAPDSDIRVAAFAAAALVEGRHHFYPRSTHSGGAYSSSGSSRRRFPFLFFRSPSSEAGLSHSNQHRQHDVAILPKKSVGDAMGSVHEEDDAVGGVRDNQNVEGTPHGSSRSGSNRHRGGRSEGIDHTGDDINAVVPPPAVVMIGATGTTTTASAVGHPSGSGSQRDSTTAGHEHSSIVGGGGVSASPGTNISFASGLPGRSGGTVGAGTPSARITSMFSNWLSKARFGVGGGGGGSGGDGASSTGAGVGGSGSESRGGSGRRKQNQSHPESPAASSLFRGTAGGSGGGSHGSGSKWSFTRRRTTTVSGPAGGGGGAGTMGHGSRNTFNIFGGVEEETSEEDDEQEDAFNPGARVMTVTEMAQMVAHGRVLVVVARRVIDVQLWMHSHPGGASLLSQFVGMDATGVFCGKQEFGLDGRRHMHSGQAWQKAAKLTIGFIREELPASMLRTTNSFSQYSKMGGSMNAAATLMMNATSSRLHVHLCCLAKVIRRAPVIGVGAIANAAHGLGHPEGGGSSAAMSTSSGTAAPGGAAGGGAAGNGGDAKSIFGATIAASISGAKSVLGWTVGGQSVQGDNLSVLNDDASGGESDKGGGGDKQQQQQQQHSKVSTAVNGRPVRVNTGGVEFPSNIVVALDFSVRAGSWLPGWHIAIQHVVGHRAIERYYTPIEVTKTHISIIVRLYPKGTLSPVLLKLKEGDAVKMRGPIGDSSLNPYSKSGAYRWIGMIAMGTCLSPMLQLIDWHLNYNNRVNKRAIKRNKERAAAYLRRISALRSGQQRTTLSSSPSPHDGSPFVRSRQLRNTGIEDGEGTPDLERMIGELDDDEMEDLENDFLDHEADFLDDDDDDDDSFFDDDDDDEEGAIAEGNEDDYSSSDDSSGSDDVPPHDIQIHGARPRANVWEDEVSENRSKELKAAIAGFNNGKHAPQQQQHHHADHATVSTRRGSGTSGSGGGASTIAGIVGKGAGVGGEGGSEASVPFTILSRAAKQTANERLTLHSVSGSPRDSAAGSEYGGDWRGGVGGNSKAGSRAGSGSVSGKSKSGSGSLSRRKSSFSSKGGKTALSLTTDNDLRGKNRGGDSSKQKKEKWLWAKWREHRDKAIRLAESRGSRIPIRDYVPKRGMQTKMVLILCSRTEEDIILRQELQKRVLASRGMLEIHHCLQQPPPAWDGLVGRVTAQMLLSILPNPGSAIRFAAGLFNREGDDDYGSAESDECVEASRRLMRVAAGISTRRHSRRHREGGGGSNATSIAGGGGMMNGTSIGAAGGNTSSGEEKSPASYAQSAAGGGGGSVAGNSVGININSVRSRVIGSPPMSAHSIPVLPDVMSPASLIPLPAPLINGNVSRRGGSFSNSLVGPPGEERGMPNVSRSGSAHTLQHRHNSGSGSYNIQLQQQHLPIPSHSRPENESEFLTNYGVFICGRPKFCDSVKRVLDELRYPPAVIRTLGSFTPGVL